MGLCSTFWFSPGRTARTITPSHRVFVGHAEIEVAWGKRSNEVHDDLAIKIDYLSFTARVYATSSTTRAATPTASSGRARTAAAATETASDALPGINPAGHHCVQGPNTCVDIRPS